MTSVQVSKRKSTNYQKQINLRFERAPNSVTT